MEERKVSNYDDDVCVGIQLLEVQLTIEVALPCSEVTEAALELRQSPPDGRFRPSIGFNRETRAKPDEADRRLSWVSSGV